MTPEEHMRHAIQQLLNAYQDGWVLDDFVLALGLQRITNGMVESTAWVWSPAEQADWKTDGLLTAAMELRDSADIDTD